ncbi:hypothetical protein D3C86_1618710 [compost metagenome]
MIRRQREGIDVVPFNRGQHADALLREIQPLHRMEVAAQIAQHEGSGSVLVQLDRTEHRAPDLRQEWPDLPRLQRQQQQVLIGGSAGRVAQDQAAAVRCPCQHLLEAGALADPLDLPGGQVHDHDIHQIGIPVIGRPGDLGAAGLPGAPLVDHARRRGQRIRPPRCLRQKPELEALIHSDVGGEQQVAALGRERNLVHPFRQIAHLAHVPAIRVAEPDLGQARTV